jgi:hypothetical protein
MNTPPTNTTTTENPIPEIPGIDLLPKAERGARPLAGPFYSDQIELLVRAARKFRDRARPGRIFIAPEGIGFTIFRRGSKV